MTDTAESLRAATKAAKEAYKALGGNSGPNGLTPDAVKFSPEGRAAKAALDKAWARERAFNAAAAKTRYCPAAVDAAIASSCRAGRKIGGRERKLIHALLRGRD
jgi:hypothetical protein